MTRQNGLRPLVPLTRAAMLQPFVNYAMAAGVSLYPRLEAAGLPALCLEEPALAVGTHAQMVFVRDTAIEQGIDDYGWLVGGEASMHSFGPRFQNEVLGASTPYTAMRAVSRLAQSQSTGAEFHLEPTAQGVRVAFRTTFPSCAWHNHDHASAWQTHTILAILRHHLGANWQPLDVGVATAVPLSPLVLASLEGVPVETTRRISWIHIDGDCLVRGTCAPREKRTPLSLQRRVLPTGDVESVRSVLQPFLAEGNAHIDQVAELAGTSRRTLQRRLNQEGHNFSELLESVRFDLARDMLQDDSSRIIDIAMALGYNDASHFSRAFRRTTGVSPTHYRRVTERLGVLND